MKKTIALTLISCLSFAGFYTQAQSVTGYEKVYYSDPASADADDYNVSGKNAVAIATYSKFAMTLENTTNDYLLFKPEEATFHFDFGDKHPSGKPVLIKPNSSKTKTMTADGGDSFMQKAFSFETGGMYKIPVDGEAIEVEDFKLPASKNSFEAGDFKVVLKKYDASTREAKAVFECTYLGDEVALVNPANLSVRATRKKSDEEVVYANDDKKNSVEILRKGDKFKFNATFHIEGRIVDMQFATMYIVWNDTFVITSEDPIDSATLEFNLDQALTDEKK